MQTSYVIIVDVDCLVLAARSFGYQLVLAANFERASRQERWKIFTRPFEMKVELCSLTHKASFSDNMTVATPFSSRRIARGYCDVQITVDATLQLKGQKFEYRLQYCIRGLRCEGVDKRTHLLDEVDSRRTSCCSPLVGFSYGCAVLQARRGEDAALVSDSQDRRKGHVDPLHDVGVFVGFERLNAME